MRRGILGKILGRICLSLFVFVSLGIPNVAHADTLDSVLDILWKAGVIDTAVVDSKPLLDCLIQGNSVVMCGEQTGQTSSDPKITLVVDVVQAAQNNEWVTVLELTGIDLMADVACDAGIPSGGSVKDFICSEVFVAVAKKTKPVVRQVLIAVKSGALDDWLNVVAMSGPAFACDIMPDEIPSQDVVCSTLAEILTGAVEAVKEASDAIYGSAASFGEWISGQTKHMPPETYYDLNWKPWYHYGTMTQIQSYNGWEDLLRDIRDPCEDYFDSHTMSQDNAQDTCDDMRERFRREVTTFRQAIELSPNAFLHTVVKPFSAAWAITDYPKGDTSTAHKTFILNLCATDIRSKFPFPEPDPQMCPRLRDIVSASSIIGGEEMAQAIYTDCLATQAKQLPAPTVAEYECKALDQGFENLFKVDKIALEKSLSQLVITGGCAFPEGWTGPGVQLDCVDVRSYETCLGALDAANPTKRCHLSKKALAEELQGKLGGRCRHDVAKTEIQCSRPWKYEACQIQLEDYRRAIPEIADDVSCKYLENPRYLKQVERANEIITALNIEPSPKAATIETDNGNQEVSPSAPRVRDLRVSPDIKPAIEPEIKKVYLKNCDSNWDPLAITCKRPKVLWELSERLPGASLPLCKPGHDTDPDKNGADAPCYNGPYPIGDPRIRTPKTLIDLPKNENVLIPNK